MNRRALLPLALLSMAVATLSGCSSKSEPASNQQKPNVVIFYVDDLGWGDVGAYGATRVKTPNIDELADNGIRFTDGHASASTCTPSRYSLLTGEFAFRKGARVLPGDAAMLIKPDVPTLPKLFKKAGYETAVVGKWHLGLGAKRGEIDWNGAVKPGPLEIGFDYSFLLPATGDRVPAVYLENHTVLNLSKDDPLSVHYRQKIGDRPTGYENPELLRQAADDTHDKSIINGISRIGWMAGGKSAEWVDEEFHTVFTEKANRFIADNAKKPFFLYFAFHDIHVPRLPNEQFQGATEMGPRGDAIVQMDWITGQVVDELERQGVLDNTLIIFTSDNGAVLNDGYEDQAVELLGSHKPNGVFRGGKYSAFEAGTRVPFIVHYPAKVKPGVSDAVISQIDIYASMAEMLDIPLAQGEAIDSFSVLSALTDATAKNRDEILEESFTLSLRDGAWKYIYPTKQDKSRIQKRKKIEVGLSKTAQLYNLAQDPSEQHNLAEKEPQRVADMHAKIDAIKARSQR